MLPLIKVTTIPIPRLHQITVPDTLGRKKEAKVQNPYQHHSFVFTPQAKTGRDHLCPQSDNLLSVRLIKLSDRHFSKSASQQMNNSLFFFYKNPMMNGYPAITWPQLRKPPMCFSLFQPLGRHFPPTEKIIYTRTFVRVKTSTHEDEAGGALRNDHAGVLLLTKCPRNLYITYDRSVLRASLARSHV